MKVAQLSSSPKFTGSYALELNPLPERCKHMILTIDVTDDFSEDLDQLRLACFPGASVESSRDEFDERSFYIRIRHGEQVSAYGRLTPGPDSVFETWSRGKAQIPTGYDVADLGRCLVHPDYRGLDLISLLCVEAHLVAASMGFRKVVGAVIPSRKLKDRPVNLGFHPCGAEVEEYEPNGNTVLIQPLLSEVNEQSISKYERKRNEIIQALAQQDVLVEGATATTYEQYSPLGNTDLDTEIDVSRMDFGEARAIERGSPVKVVQVGREHADDISRLRVDAYSQSSDFSLTSTDFLNWSEEDNTSLVLAVKSENGEFLATMRSTPVGQDHILRRFLSDQDNRVVIFQRAATLPGHAAFGYNRLLRNALIAAERRRGTQLVLGEVYEGAPRVNSMRELGYTFEEIPDQFGDAEFSSDQRFLLAKLDLSAGSSRVKEGDNTSGKSFFLPPPLAIPGPVVGSIAT